MAKDSLSKIELAAVELHTILWEHLGHTADWSLTVEYHDDEVAERFCQALDRLRNAIREELPDHAPSPEPFG